jgi:hypothetical protein
LTPDERKRWKDFQAAFRGQHLAWLMEVWQLRRARREEVGDLAEQLAMQLKELFKEMFESLTGIRVEPDDVPIRPEAKPPANGAPAKAAQQPQPKGKAP